MRILAQDGYTYPSLIPLKFFRRSSGLSSEKSLSLRDSMNGEVVDTLIDIVKTIVLKLLPLLVVLFGEGI